MSDTKPTFFQRVGKKVKSGLKLGLKAAVVAGAVLGVKHKVDKDIAAAKEKAQAAGVVGQAVAQQAPAAIGHALNPLAGGANDAQQAAVGLAAAGAIDPVGAAQNIQNPPAQAPTKPAAPPIARPLAGADSGGAGGIADARGGSFDLRECDIKHPRKIKDAKARSKCKKEMRKRFK